VLAVRLVPPIQSGLSVVWIGPLLAFVATLAPFRNSRNAPPSYVTARCVQSLTETAVGPLRLSTPPPNVTPPEGRRVPASLLALRK
jgi:hypothetical protein